MPVYTSVDTYSEQFIDCFLLVIHEHSVTKCLLISARGSESRFWNMANLFLRPCTWLMTSMLSVLFAMTSSSLTRYSLTAMTSSRLGSRLQMEISGKGAISRLSYTWVVAVKARYCLNSSNT